MQDFNPSIDNPDFRYFFMDLAWISNTFEILDLIVDLNPDMGNNNLNQIRIEKIQFYWQKVQFSSLFSSKILKTAIEKTKISQKILFYHIFASDRVLVCFSAKKSIA